MKNKNSYVTLDFYVEEKFPDGWQRLTNVYDSIEQARNYINIAAGHMIHNKSRYRIAEVETTTKTFYHNG